MSQRVKSVAVLYDGIWFEGSTHEAVVRQLKVIDWEDPTTPLDFKRNVGQRAKVFNTHLVFWDAESFLAAMLEAGFISCVQEEYYK